MPLIQTGRTVTTEPDAWSPAECMETETKCMVTTKSNVLRLQIEMYADYKQKHTVTEELNVCWLQNEMYGHYKFKRMLTTNSDVC